METAQGVALVGFVLLAVFVGLVTRRAGGALYRTRVAEGFRGSTGDLSRRVNLTLGELAAVIDLLRRREADVESVRPSLAAGRDAALRYAAEARALSGPASTLRDQTRMVEELERVERALAMVDHGCALAIDGPRAVRGQEADTAIKRGYLNLLHARESFTEHAAAAMRAAEVASPARRVGRLLR
ncbi:MAG: hypothetical protein HYX54_06920 [Chloroflexi bacterium]|nr:hypothetical protein [Chloroflexota bacterium]